MPTTFPLNFKRLQYHNIFKNNWKNVYGLQEKIETYHFFRVTIINTDHQMDASEFENLLYKILSEESKDNKDLNIKMAMRNLHHSQYLNNLLVYLE